MVANGSAPRDRGSPMACLQGGENERKVTREMAKFKGENGGLTCPCYGCDERSVECHGYCPKYAKYQKENEEFRANKRREDMKGYYAKYLNNKK